MILNYLTLALRHLRKNVTYTVINILGLAISISACVLIAQYASFELSYDEFHEHAQNSYRVHLDIYKNDRRESQSARVAPAVATALQNEFSEIDTYTRLITLGPDGVLTHHDRYAAAADIMLADSAFFDVFSFHLFRGNKQGAFREPFCIVITESTAHTIFGAEDPIGKEVIINAKNFDGVSVPFKVTGVIEDFPENTHLKAGVLISYPTLFTFVGHRFDNSWSWNETYTYFRLHPNTDARALQAKFPEVVHRFNAQLADQQLDWQYTLQPVTDIHLHSDLKYELTANGKAMHVYLLIGVGVVLLLIAYINFVNLVTVKAMQRAKEVGIRKVSGAQRKQLRIQFFVEALVLNILAIVLAILFSDVTRPWMADLFAITFSNTLYSHLETGIGFLFLLLMLMLGSGLYPAVVLSRYKPIDALRERYSKGESGKAVRKLFVTAQFTIAMILIALTLSAIVQVRFMQRGVLGFDPEQIVVIRSPKAHDYGYGTNFSGFKNKVSQLAQVTSVSAANVVPGREIYWYDDQVTLNGEETSGVFSMLAVASNYFSHYNIPLIHGRMFTEHPQDQNKWIINESAMRLLTTDTTGQIVGQQLNNREIIGVIKDFHQESLKTTIPPVMFTVGEVFNFYTVKLKADQAKRTLEDIKSVYTTLFPGSPYEYFFLDEFYDRQYKADLLFNELFGMFSGLAILVACLGLFGLSSYLTARRAKEIGLRKVMGASITHAVALLAGDFVRLVLVAGLVAIPVAYGIVDRWLENYAFRVEMVWWLFVAPLAFILVLTIITVSVQTIRTALINPAVCLRHE